MSGPEVVIYLIWTVWAVSWTAAAAWSSSTVKRASISSEAVYRVLTIAGFVILFGFSNGPPHWWLRLWHAPGKLGWSMAVLTLASFGFAWWARIHLGRLWSGGVTRKSDHRVVDSGPYAYVRHPIYTALISAALWLALVKGTAPAFAGFALIAAGYWIKARLEEGFLREELGPQAYDSYRARVAMLVPFLRF
jgi:protein-S-isoprenylcysteine O-methyltransferase Ste14